MKTINAWAEVDYYPKTLLLDDYKISLWKDIRDRVFSSTGEGDDLTDKLEELGLTEEDVDKIYNDFEKLITIDQNGIELQVSESDKNYAVFYIPFTLNVEVA